MFKNIFTSLAVIFSLITSSVAQVPNYTLESNPLVLKRSELVTQPKSIELIVKERFRDESFVLKGEIAKHQGYILTIQDRKIITGILERCERSCGSLVDVVDESCQEDLAKCQEDCDQRVKTIEDKNEQLRLDKIVLEKKLSAEEKKVLIFSSISAFVGAGLGALIMTISK